MSARRLWQRVRTGLAMRADHRGLVLEAAARLLLARIVLLAIPFPRLAARWGLFVPPGDPRAAARPSDDDPERALRDDAGPVTGPMAGRTAAQVARRVRWAIATAAPAMPFKADCVQQAVAARGMLARRGLASVVHFGIDAAQGLASSDGATAIGHAWLDAGDVTVTGFPLDPSLIELGCFVRAAPGAAPAAASDRRAASPVRLRTPFPGEYR